MPDPISLFNGVPKAAAAAKKKKNKTHKKDCSIDLFISQSNGRSIVRSYWSVWSFDRLINSSLLCAIFGLLVLILSLDFHAQLMFMTSDCVAAITQLNSTRLQSILSPVAVAQLASECCTYLESCRLANLANLETRIAFAIWIYVLPPAWHVKIKSWLMLWLRRRNRIRNHFPKADSNIDADADREGEEKWCIDRECCKTKSNWSMREISLPSVGAQSRAQLINNLCRKRDYV